MIKVQTGQGEITISSAVFTTITGAAATNCFGVKGMAYRSRCTRPAAAGSHEQGREGHL